MATQDKEISTNCFKNKFWRKTLAVNAGYVNNMKKLLTTNFRKNEYLMRHNKVCTHLCYSICKALGIRKTDKWYTYTHKPVYEQEYVTVLWNQAVYIDREITANKPDIIIENKQHI